MSITWDRPLTFEPHAVERFRERWVPWLGLRAARNGLAGVVERALNNGTYRLDVAKDERSAVWALSDVRIPPIKPTADMLLAAAQGTGWEPRTLCLTATHMGVVKTVLPPGATKPNRRPRKP